jgi:hypothetical protein
MQYSVAGPQPPRVFKVAGCGRSFVVVGPQRNFNVVSVSRKFSVAAQRPPMPRANVPLTMRQPPHLLLILRGFPRPVALRK